MKVAYFINQYPKVSHSFIRREIQALERQGLQIQRLALRGWDEPLPDAEDARERGLTRYVLRNGAAALLLPTIAAAFKSPRKFFAAAALAAAMSRQSRTRPLIYHFVYLAEACLLLKWIREFGADHLHAHFGTNSTEIAMLAHALGGPPFSFTVHGPDEYLENMGLAKKVEHSAFAVTVSSFGRSQLCLRIPYRDWHKVHVVHCGLESHFFAEAGSEPTGAPRLICVGRLSEAKGQLLLLEAVAALVRRGIAVELLLAGDGPMRTEVERLVRTLGLETHVRITGWISSSEVRAQILASRALVLPSFAEGLPVVLMEAMALRRPVLSTYIAGIPELVRPGRNGWLFPAGSVEALTAALEECLAMSSAELRALGDEGYARARARHDIDVEAHKLSQLFSAAAAPA